MLKIETNSKSDRDYLFLKEDTLIVVRRSNKSILIILGEILTQCLFLFLQDLADTD